MQRLILAFAFLVNLIGVPCYGNEGIVRVTNPIEVKSEVIQQHGIPKELEGLQWNRWTSKNFVVCALDDAHAQYLHKHLELVKGWVYARWGLMDLDFAAECKVIAVGRKDLFKKLFNLEATRVEIRRDETGKIKERVIFLLTVESPSQTVPTPLTEVCLAELAQRHNLKVGLWAFRGMGQLNGTIPQIKERIVELKGPLDRNDPLFFSRGILEMDQVQYQKLDDAKKKLYDNCSMVFCLMLRKEFGQDHYLRFLKAHSEGLPESALKSVLGFSDYDHFDRTMKRYLIDLSRDVVGAKTPDSYLQIREKY